MTVKQRVGRIIMKKLLILISVALLLGAFCYFASKHNHIPNHNNMHLIYNISTAVISIAVLLFISFKMRLFHDLFAKEFTGTVLSVEREILLSHRWYWNMDDVILSVRLDGSSKKRRMRLPGNKVGNNVYFVGDRIHRLKGTRYPINITREEAQHICPVCGHDSCSNDECPDCKIKY